MEMETVDENMLHSKTWRSVFYVSAGIAVLIAVGGVLTVDPDQPSKEKDKRVDWIGSALITSGLVLIIFVLSDGAIAPRGWRTPCKHLSMSPFFANGSARGRRADVHFITRRHHRVSCGWRHLDCVLLLLERISLEGSRKRIVDGLVATSSADSWRLVVPRKWAVPSDSHDCTVDVVFIPVQQFLGAWAPSNPSFCD